MYGKQFSDAGNWDEGRFDLGFVDVEDHVSVVVDHGLGTPKQ